MIQLGSLVDAHLWLVLRDFAISYTAPVRRGIVWYMRVECIVIAIAYVDRENEEMNVMWCVLLHPGSSRI